MNIHPKSFSAEMEFRKIGPWAACQWKGDRSSQNSFRIGRAEAPKQGDQMPNCFWRKYIFVERSSTIERYRQPPPPKKMETIVNFPHRARECQPRALIARNYNFTITIFQV
jgi:hypothetical protein